MAIEAGFGWIDCSQRNADQTWIIGRAADARLLGSAWMTTSISAISHRPISFSADAGLGQFDADGAEQYD